uniref:Uncharacterized protein n=1 Tax=Anguilla anguilla TaxID=7936 RepID=A0A0E9TKW6_ANGAN
MTSVNTEMASLHDLHPFGRVQVSFEQIHSLLDTTLPHDYVLC